MPDPTAAAAPAPPPTAAGPAAGRLDAVVVGAGFAGLYMLHRLRGLGFAARVIEAGAGVGGTWYWNRYPGARCDTETMGYSFGFDEALQQEWKWSERFATRAEICRYLDHVADRFDLRRDIELGTRVTTATWDEAAGAWTVGTDRGTTLTATHLVMASGCLSSWQLPNIPGRDSFGGVAHHTGNWPHEPVDFTGKRVAVIGTGSSGVQSIPLIAQEAAHVTVFQRTPSFSVPAGPLELDPAFEREIKARYAAFREEQRASLFGVPFPLNEQSALAATPEEREREYAERWRQGGIGILVAYADLLTDREASETIAEFFRNRIREVVRDPVVAERLCPRGYAPGTKRLVVDIGYYETYNRDNVTLVDVHETPILEITPAGIRTAAGELELDVIVYATGFDAMTGALLNVDIRGREGISLRDAWADGPRAYLGIAIAGFPNLFSITGPGSPSVLSNVVVSIEQDVEWISGLLASLRDRGLATAEATPEAQAAWVEHVNAVAEATLFPSTASWYSGSNIAGKPRVFMPYVGGVGTYRDECAAIAAQGYAGFALGG